MPTYNRGFVITKFLDSLIDQSYKDWELIIVDDASNDGTLDVIANYAKCNQKIRLYRLNQHKGLPTARNIGVGLSKGQLIYFGEDDIVFCSNNSLQVLVETFFTLISSFNMVGAVGPRMIGSNGYEWLNFAAQIGLITRHTYHNFTFTSNNIVQVPFLHSCSLISKKAFQQVGGFDERFYPGTHAKEEVDFYYRLHKTGYTLFFQSGSSILHDHAPGGGCDSRKKLRRYYFEFRNSLLFFTRFNGFLGPFRLITLPFIRKIFPRRVL